jgi:hypothetical protein
MAGASDFESQRERRNVSTSFARAKAAFANRIDLSGGETSYKLKLVISTIRETLPISNRAGN